MKYSEEFKEKFRKYFQGEDYEKLLDKGSVWVGRYIEDTLVGCKYEFPFEKIVESVENNEEINNMHEIYAKSKEIIELDELDTEFRNLYMEEFRSNDSQPEMGE